MTKSDFSMQSVRTLFKLDLKSRYGISPDAGKLKKFAQFGNILFLSSFTPCLWWASII